MLKINEVRVPLGLHCFQGFPRDLMLCLCAHVQAYELLDHEDKLGKYGCPSRFIFFTAMVVDVPNSFAAAAGRLPPPASSSVFASSASASNAGRTPSSSASSSAKRQVLFFFLLRCGRRPDPCCCPDPQGRLNHRHRLGHRRRLTPAAAASVTASSSSSINIEPPSATEVTMKVTMTRGTDGRRYTTTTFTYPDGREEVKVEPRAAP
jgi:hypothetical protein